MVTPAGQAGVPGELRISPDLSFLTVVNETTTVAEPVRRLRLASAIRETGRRTEPDPLKLLRAEDVAELLELPVRTVYDQAAAGAIPHRRFGKHDRFSREDVEAIEQQMDRGSSSGRPSVRAA